MAFKQLVADFFLRTAGPTRAHARADLQDGKRLRMEAWDIEWRMERAGLSVLQPQAGPVDVQSASSAVAAGPATVKEP